jgi:hypothetical protein
MILPHLRDPDDRVPELPPWVVADLAARANDVDPGDIAYGEPLPAIVERFWPWREWLQAALFGGHLPFLEDLQLALRGDFEWWKAKITEGEEEGFFGDAIPDAEGVAQAYRDIVVMLEDFVAALEDRAATMNERQPERDVDPKYPKMWREDAEASRARAKTARQRAASAREDNESYRHMRGRYMT